MRSHGVDATETPVTTSRARALPEAARRAKLVALGITTSLSLAARGNLKRIPISILTDEYGFSFAPHGWHYFRDLLAERVAHPDISMEDSTFCRFFQHPRVRSVRYLNDVLFLHQPDQPAQRDGFKFYLGTYPWGGWGKAESAAGGTPWGQEYDRVEGKSTRDLFGYRRNPWYAPGDPYPLAIEWNQTIELYRSLGRGYRPVWHGSYPSVILLIRANGEMRAIRRDGNHRLAVLTHLGRQRLTVWVAADSVGTVRETEADQWLYVRSGLCNKELALSIFNAYFDFNGRERLESLGLTASY